MKRLLVLAVIAFLVFTGSAVWAGQFGAPEPQAQAGKFAFGIGYFYSTEKLKPADDTFTSGAIVANDFWQKANFIQHQAYLQGNYGFMKNWEVFGRIGGADMRVKDAYDFVAYTEDAKDNAQFFAGMGVKGILWQNKTFSIGPIVQANYYSKYKDSAVGSIAGTNYTIDYESKDNWDVNLAVAVQAKFNGFTLYAGPFVYWRNNKITLDVTGGGATAGDSVKYESENNVGGFGGIRIPVTKNISFEVEGQYTNRFSGGAAVVYNF